VTIPIYDDNNVVWSGAITGRKRCDETGNNCLTSDCGNNGDGNCIPSRGFMQPSTQAEMTFNKAFVDFYDITVINGITLGISMTPKNEAPAPETEPYNCGAAGAIYSRTSTMDGCTWSFDPPLQQYLFVERGGASCSTHDECTVEGEVCGFSSNPGQSPMLQMTCGSLLGFWSANQICGVQRDYGEPFNCS
jgi:hypothetical protein